MIKPVGIYKLGSTNQITIQSLSLLVCKGYTMQFCVKTVLHIANISFIKCEKIGSTEKC